MVAAVIPYTDSIHFSAGFTHKILLIIIFVLLILVLTTAIVVCDRVIVKKLEKEISHLKIVIDEEIKNHDIEHITKDEFFKDLAKKIESIKK